MSMSASETIPIGWPSSSITGIRRIWCWLIVRSTPSTSSPSLHANTGFAMTLATGMARSGALCVHAAMHTSRSVIVPAM